MRLAIKWWDNIKSKSLCWNNKKSYWTLNRKKIKLKQKFAEGGTSEGELKSVNIEAEWNELTMQMSSDKIPTFEDTWIVEEGVAGWTLNISLWVSTSYISEFFFMSFNKLNKYYNFGENINKQKTSF